jgi:hypothetical protein
MGPWNRKNIRKCAPTSSRRRPAGLPQRVLAGGEVPGKDGVAQHDLQNTGCCLGGDVLGEWGWNTAGGEEGRGRDGVLAFPARGRRTQATKARISTGER